MIHADSMWWIVSFLLLAGVIVFLWRALVKSRNMRNGNIRDASLSSEELEDHARNVAIQHAVTSHKNRMHWPLPRLNDNFDMIHATYLKLNLEVQKKHVVPNAAEWLLDNFHVIEEQVKVLRMDFSRKSYRRLPILKSGPLKGYARIYAVAAELVSHTDGQVDDSILAKYLNAYQTHSTLFDRELGAVSMVMLLAIIEYIRHLCEGIEDTLRQWHKADEIVDIWQKYEKMNSDDVARQIAKNLKTADEADPSFIEHLFYRLRRSGLNYASVLRAVDEHLEKFETDTARMTQKEHNAQSISTVSMGKCILSIQAITSLNGPELFDATSFIERILRKDPDGSYPLMDVATRSYYRGRVEEIASSCGVSELHVAREAVELANAAKQDAAASHQVQSNMECTGHVGYYLLGKGMPMLINRQKGVCKSMPQLRGMVKNRPGVLYFGSIGLITLLLTGVAVRYALYAAPVHAALLSIIAGFFVLVPASEIAVSLVNWVVSTTIKPTVFPRMELKNGIPEHMGTIVAVPTLLPNENRAIEIISNLEEHYLRNREDNLYFALIGAFQDSDSPNALGDARIIEAALYAVAELNRKYAPGGKDIFYFFHRESQFNPESNKWIGWERKRGALMEFNALVLGSADTSFAYASNRTPPFSNVKYIITLDSDTILPMGMARKMVGTMAHPLNRPVIDPNKGIVTAGYGLMQPRIDVDSESSNKTFFARVFAGHEGLDPYSNAISDVYQDLFGEGIFTGKGIYDLRVFQQVLKNAIPDNTILSHDLLEGSYLRTGLVTDLRLIDSFPSHYNSFSARLHRWVRGDWQLLPRLSGNIFARNCSIIPNPLPGLSRWKMLDNLRRSLIAPALMVLAALSFSILPGSIFVWLGFFFAALASPFMFALIQYIASQRFSVDRVKRYIPVIIGLKSAFLQLQLSFILLPYQAFHMISAIAVTLGRVFITQKNMLEWIPSADVEKTQQNSLKSYWAKMWISVCGALAITALAFVLKPETVWLSLLFLAHWGNAPTIAYRVSIERGETLPQASQDDIEELRRIARKTWRYFEEFSNTRTHCLAPDNYQVDPPRGIARRTSPTNIGLGLMAILTARDFGYIGTSNMAELIGNTMATVEKLEKWNGHLYNWYDTNTLALLRPAYISSVDSGNFVGYLIALRQGLKEYLASPLIDARSMQGIGDTLRCAGKEGVDIFRACCAGHAAPSQKPVDLLLFCQTVHELLREEMTDAIRNTVWRNKARRILIMYSKELSAYFPGIGLLSSKPEDKGTGGDSVQTQSDFQLIVDMIQENPPLQDLPALYEDMVSRIDTLTEAIRQKPGDGDAEKPGWLDELKNKLIEADGLAKQLIYNVKGLMDRMEALCDATDFQPLYVKKRQLFSIGYNVEDNKLSNSYYDLLASEARQTSYISIAKGQISPEHWFRMGRALTVEDGYKGLISWTGTMFEYLMPLLLMKSYRNTLLDETYSFVIKNQIKYGKLKDMPWGVSESGFNALDRNLDYQYKAMGIPWLGLKRGLGQDAVTTPYATFLALLVSPEAAIRNIRRLKEEGLDGSHGFYEAADYTPERLPFETRRAIVKSFMAHHAGMSLVAINNYLHQGVMQQRFHADPEINAARLLLQEKIPVNLLFTKETREKMLPFKGMVTREKSPVRSLSQPDAVLPQAHMLSNGNYTIMITDRGTGYSKNRLVAVTRWRADSVLDPFGMFFYVRNETTNAVWSAAYAPLNVLPEKYEVVFTSDKTVFKRMDGKIETKTEIMVASGDNVEIRRLSLRNTGDAPCTLEVTSYFEVVLATQAADTAHPAFSNLFVETSYQKDKNCIIANRRPRSESDKSLWVANSIVVEADTQGDIQYETDRMQWIGRGNTMKNPLVMERSKPLSNTVGTVLDPAMSFRVRVIVAPGKTASIAYVVSFSENKELLLALVEKYETADSVDKAFQLALTRSQVETAYLNLKADEIELYQDMIRDLIFLSPGRKAIQCITQENRKGQSSLWRYGISGDLPVVLVMLKEIDRLEVLYEVLKAQEYWRLMDLKVDLVIVSEAEYSYSLPLFTLVTDIVISNQTHSTAEMPKDIFLLDVNKVLPEDICLLHAVARVIVRGDGKSLAEQVHLPQSLPLPTIPLPAVKATPYSQAAIPERSLRHFNGLGGFSLTDNEYVIRLEDGHNTPAPWVNVIANPDFGFIVSEAGSGYTWEGNSRENKLTPWSNDAVCDSPGEAMYICDTDTGELWTPTPMPIRESEPYTIRHGFGYSVFEHDSHGIEQSLTLFVPVSASVKIGILRLKNTSGQQRHLALTYYAQVILGVGPQETAMHVQSGTSESGMLWMVNHYNDELAGKFCFVDAALEQRSVTGDRKTFFGNGDMASPDSLKVTALSGETGAGLDPCAAMQGSITLEADESREIVLMLGAANGLDAAETLASRYRRPEDATAALQEVQNFWKDKMNIVQVDVPGSSMNTLLNGWLPYQVIACRLWAKSGFYQSGGAFGFRDQLQDCISIAHLWPQAARKQILLHARHQFVQGDVMHWWHDPEGKGTRTRSSDDLLWLPYATAEYIRITGDSRILKEELPFVEAPLLSEFEDERYSTPTVSDTTATLFEHCVLAIEKALRFGKHGLPLMGSGDWNDGMNTVGNGGLGESVWVGWFLISILEKFAPLCRMLKDKQRANRYDGIRREIAASIEHNAWDGNWYRRAYFDDGTPLGSVQNNECKIDSIAQTWSVISGAGDPQRVMQAMNSLEDYLILRKDGLIMLFTPPFDEGDLEPGYIKGYVPGVRENGGQYTHAAAWAIIAFARMGEGNKASELFELISPINHTLDSMGYSRYKTEPYVMAADVYAVHPNEGRGGWTWYTGAAGWMYRAGLEYILGFQKNGETVLMDPCIPAKWHEYTLKYQYMDTPYVITVQNPEGVCKGVIEIRTDGIASPGNILNLVNDGVPHEVQVMMGRGTVD